MLQIGLNFVPGIACQVVVLDDKESYPQLMRDLTPHLALVSGGFLATQVASELTVSRVDYVSMTGNEENPLNILITAEDKTPYILVHNSALRGMTDEEVEGILHHESAHHTLGHVEKMAEKAAGSGVMEIGTDNIWELEADAAGAKATSKKTMIRALKKVINNSLDFAIGNGKVPAEKRDAVLAKAMANEAMVERFAALAV